MNISEIAHIAGVSTATVSRVINHSPAVKPETKEKVMQVIAEFGYTPSAIARSLSIQSSLNIGVIFPDIANPFFSGALNGLSKVAEEYRYNVFFCNSDENTDKEHRFLEQVKEQRLEGIIISPVDTNDRRTLKLLEGLEKAGIPVVLLDRDLKDGNFSMVIAENEKGAFDAVQVLVNEGHRKIAIIEGSPSNRPVYERTEGYKKAMKAAGIPIRSEYIVRGNQKSDPAYEMTGQLMRLDDPPTAIFTCNNMMTIGCIQYLTEQGIRIGKDISLIGFDDIEVLRIVNFGLSVVHRSETEMGKIAMEMLVRRMKDPDGKKEKVVLPTEIILRGSEKSVIG